MVLFFPVSNSSHHVYISFLSFGSCASKRGCGAVALSLILLSTEFFIPAVPRLVRSLSIVCLVLIALPPPPSPTPYPIDECDREAVSLVDIHEYGLTCDYI